MKLLTLMFFSFTNQILLEKFSDILDFKTKHILFSFLYASKSGKCTNKFNLKSIKI